MDFVSEKLDGYFYYVMELGDSLEAGWEHEPSSYKPRDLVSERARSHGSRLPVLECVRIGLALTDALDFLHRHGLTHRDIKPQNIIFVNGQPKLADMGLIAEIRPPDQKRNICRHARLYAAAAGTSRHAAGGHLRAGHGALCVEHRAQRGVFPGNCDQPG